MVFSKFTHTLLKYYQASQRFSMEYAEREKGEFLPFLSYFILFC